MPSLLRASILLAAVTGIGCSAPVVDDVADASGAMTEGVVVVERTVSGDGATQTNVSAKFMRLSTPADPDLAETVVGSRLDLPATGTCRLLAPGSVNAGARNGAIELIDVGDVTLRAGTSRMPLAVRAFPDVGDLVSGMFYTSPDTAGELPAGAVYTLEGTGSGLVERFAVDTEAPLALEDVRVGGRDGGDPQTPGPAGTALADGAALDEGAAVTVHWRSPEARTTDVVLVDVSAASGAQVRCSFRDEGAGVVPGWILRSTTLGALPATATLSVHRVRERAFSSPGIDAGEVRFDLSVMGRIFVTSPTLGDAREHLPTATAAARP
jgi:hypothetical protein